MARHLRRRRKVVLDTNNQDRWVVSYADFITLLFAFFVVMYSMSSVNEGKYKSLTESLGSAFSNQDKPKTTPPPAPPKPEPAHDTGQPTPQDILNIPFESMKPGNQATLGAEKNLETATVNNNASAPEPIELFLKGSQVSPDVLDVTFEATAANKQATTEIAGSPALPETETTPDSDSIEPSLDIGKSSFADLLSIPFEALKPDKQTTAEIEKTRELSEGLLKEMQQLKQASNQLETALQPFIDDNLVAVKRNDYWIELEMNSELLFLSGEAALSSKAQPALQKIAQVINTLPNAVHVEGHTDNVPIDNQIFPSNWELSSARATSMVREFIKQGTDPTRLSAIGYGEFHPIGDNTTEEGRFKNRRVTLVLMSQAFSRYGANDEERAKLLNLAPTADVTPAPDNKP
jgi:chemotaxis protein MotB